MSSVVTVTVKSNTTTTDALGDGTTSTATSSIPGVLYAPRSSQESVGTRSPKVYVAASLYFVAGVPSDVSLNADDTIVITAAHPMIDGTYQVDGVPGYWGGPVEVAITRTGEV